MSEMIQRQPKNVRHYCISDLPKSSKWPWRRMEKIKEKVTNEQLLECIEEKTTLLNNILCRTDN